MNVQQVFTTITNSEQIPPPGLGGGATGPTQVHREQEGPQRKDKKLYNAYTIADKLTILDWHHANGDNRSLTMKRFGIDRKQLIGWTLAENEYRQMPFSEFRHRRVPSRGDQRRQPWIYDLEQAVLSWCKEQTQNNKVPTNKEIRSKAIELGQELGVPVTFKATTQWLLTFKKRYANEIEMEPEKQFSSDRTNAVLQKEPNAQEELPTQVCIIIYILYKVFIALSHLVIVCQYHVYSTV